VRGQHRQLRVDQRLRQRMKDRGEIGPRSVLAGHHPIIALDK
jgi:hypothetical protein